MVILKLSIFVGQNFRNDKSIHLIIAQTYIWSYFWSMVDVSISKFTDKILIKWKWRQIIAPLQYTVLTLFEHTQVRSRQQASKECEAHSKILTRSHLECCHYIVIKHYLAAFDIFAASFTVHRHLNDQLQPRYYCLAFPTNHRNLKGEVKWVRTRRVLKKLRIFHVLSNW